MPLMPPPGAMPAFAPQGGAMPGPGPMPMQAPMPAMGQPGPMQGQPGPQTSFRAPMPGMPGPMPQAAAPQMPGQPGMQPPPPQLPPGALQVLPQPPKAPALREPEPAEEDEEGADVGQLTQWFLTYAEKKQPEMTEARESRHYYHGDQWTAEERRILAARKQPVITANRVARKINSIIGLIERLRQDPKAFARTPEHEAGAEVATAALRFVSDMNHFPQTRTEVAFDIAISGLGGIELGIEPADDGRSYDVTYDRIAPETFFYDPRSVKPDFGDAQFLGVYKWMDLDAAIELMPDKEDALRAAMDLHGSDNAADGLRDWEKLWYDSRLSRVKIVECWYRHNSNWWVAIHTGDTILIGSKSPFVDEKGRTVHKYEVMSGEIDADGDRYGFVRNLRGPQDEVNHRRSKSLHLLNVRQVKATQGAVHDVEAAKAELAKPDGWVEVNPGENMELLDTHTQMQGHLELLQDAKQEIDQFGPNPELMGQGGKDQSGRAIQLLQQAGISELGPYVVRMRAWALRVYRKTWWLIKSHWTGERYIRISGEGDEVQFLVVNRPVMTPYGPTLENSIGHLDVDIILDEGPDTVTLRDDVAGQLADMAAKGIPIPPEIVVETSGLPPELKRKLIAKLQEQGQQPKPEQIKLQAAQQQAAADQQKGQLELQLRQLDLQKAQIDAQIRAQELQAAQAQQAGQAAPVVDPKLDIERERLAVERQKVEASLAENAARFQFERQQHVDKMNLEHRKLQASAEAKEPAQSGITVMAGDGATTALNEHLGGLGADLSAGLAQHVQMAQDTAAQNAQVLAAALDALRRSQDGIAMAMERFAQAADRMSAPRHSRLVLDNEGNPIGSVNEPVSHAR